MSFNPRPRRFPRLQVPEEARVYDQNGRELGTVSQVSGNGMSLEAASASILESLPVGTRLRVSIVEPGSRETNVLVVAVRNREGSKLGMEFVEAIPNEPL